MSEIYSWESYIDAKEIKPGENMEHIPDAATAFAIWHFLLLCNKASFFMSCACPVQFHADMYNSLAGWHT